MRKYHPLTVVALGVLLIVVGAVGGVFFAGLPGPDDSLAEVERVAMHGNIAFAGMCVGGCFS